MKKPVRTLLSILISMLFLAATPGRAQTSPPPAAPASSPQLRGPGALLLSQPNIDTTSAVEAKAEFDPPVIRPGGVSTYRVTFNAMMDAIRWPEDVIAPEALEMKSSARGQTMVGVVGSLKPFSAFNYRTRVTKPGTFTVPRFMVYVYGKPVTVPEASLDVVSNPATPVVVPPQLVVEPGITNPFVGQVVPVRSTMTANQSGVLRPLSMMKLNGEGFLTEPLGARQRVEMTKGKDNKVAAVATFIYEATITPIQAGPLSLSAQGFASSLNAAGPIVITGHVTIPGAPPTPILVGSEPVVLNVRPLPREGELPGFTGAIGRFKLDPPRLEANVLRVGEPVTLTINVRGEGNLGRLVPPPPPRVSGWRVFAGRPDPASDRGIRSRGFIIFTYTLIPTREEVDATPAIPFSYFDPDKAEYVDLTLPTVAVSVQPSVIPTDQQALAALEAPAAPRQDQPQLSGLATRPGRTMKSLVPLQSRAWFPLLQIAPALFFGGLWWWDKRRRFHEAHPEVLLRRRARRALHREWAAVRRAASLGDTPRFAACAVNAMRIACAPHYPAEPRALVSSDVLPLLGNDARDGANVVRQIFAAANEDRFNTRPADVKDLLTLRAGLDRVLANLEDKLR